MRTDFLEGFEKKTKKIETPFLVIYGDKIKENYINIVKAFNFASVYYAIKANYDPGIMKILNSIDAKFEVGSQGELDKVRKLSVPPSRIIVSNPLKEPRFISEAYNYGLDVFAFDSMYELDKLSKLAPKSKVFVRLEVSNKGSDWPLSGKFGVKAHAALELMEHAKQMGLNPYGIIFHVGSQCLDPMSWNNALEKAKFVYTALEKIGIKLKAINLGGGLPVKNTKKIPNLVTISKHISSYLKENFPRDLEVYIEPGRAVVGDSGFLVSTIIARAVRNEKNWISLDLGVFNGLADSLGGFEWEYATNISGPIKEFILAGPSCDSTDKISTSVRLPDVNIGDRIYILNSVAYTTVYASDFDGFRIPRVHYF